MKLITLFSNNHPKFSIDKRNTIKKLGWASAALASTAIQPSFSVSANTSSPSDDLTSTQKTNLSTYSPYSNIESNTQWLKGDIHSHVDNFIGNERYGGGSSYLGGRVTNGELMSILSKQGLSFGGLTGHECFLGEHNDPDGINAPALIMSDIPDNFTPITLLENQNQNERPNWPSDHAYDELWQSIDYDYGHIHRLYPDSPIDKGFIIGHPDYYGDTETLQQIEEACKPIDTAQPEQRQRVLGVETYNRFADDRCTTDIEALGSKEANPFGFEVWDLLLNAPQHDYPIWAFASDCSFLHAHNLDDTNSDWGEPTTLGLPPAVTYRNNKGLITLALSEDFNHLSLIERQAQIRDNISAGKFYATCGHFAFTQIRYDDQTHTLTVSSDTDVEWVVYHNREQIPLALNSQGQCYIKKNQDTMSITCQHANIETQIGGYTRLEARVTREMVISSIEADCFYDTGFDDSPVWSRPLMITGDLTQIATPGELLHFVSKTSQTGEVNDNIGVIPAIILGSERTSTGDTLIYVFNDLNQGHYTDPDLNTQHYLCELDTNSTDLITMKIVQRAWLQPAWSNPSKAFMQAAAHLNQATG
ncbi:hypothetical protein [uncultured Shewanella sp.]|uniref:hypothetical protein n=1 Tax=uncultured Shewanella sp. TaxID=173975 RepID=UPI00262EC4F3|nr:hypothetical protein [uncultured Shewanella sp.]